MGFLARGRSRAQKRAHGVGAVALAVFVSGGSVGAQEASPTEGVLGCYQLESDAWSGTFPERLAAFMVLPKTLRVLSERGVESVETGKALLRPRQRILNRRSWAYWERVDGRLGLSFVNEAGSIQVLLDPRAWGFIGDAFARPSVPGFNARKAVRLVRTSCDGISTAGG